MPPHTKPAKQANARTAPRSLRGALAKILIPLVLVACSDEKILPGERETLRTYNTSQQYEYDLQGNDVVQLAPANALNHWTRKHGDESVDAYKSSKNIARKRQWKRNIGISADSSAVTSIVSTAKTAYTIDKRSRLVAVRVSDGSILFRQQLPPLQQSFGNQLVLIPSLDQANDRLLLARGDGTFMLFSVTDLQATLIWHQKNPEPPSQFTTCLVG